MYLLDEYPAKNSNLKQKSMIFLFIDTKRKIFQFSAELSGDREVQVSPGIRNIRYGIQKLL
jgi:hypothetical protein